MGGDFHVLPSKYMRDGQVIVSADGAKPAICLLFVGTRPLTDVELAGAEARHIVRQGLADVLAWLGEDVGPPPVREGRGRALLERLRATPPPATPPAETGTNQEDL